MAAFVSRSLALMREPRRELLLPRLRPLSRLLVSLCRRRRGNEGGKGTNQGAKEARLSCWSSHGAAYLAGRPLPPAGRFLVAVVCPCTPPSPCCAAIALAAASVLILIAVVLPPAALALE